MCARELADVECIEATSPEFDALFRVFARAVDDQVGGEERRAFLMSRGREQ